MGSDENQNAFVIAAVTAALFIIVVGAYFVHSDDRSGSGFDDACLRQGNRFDAHERSRRCARGR
jgi:hypothetical protein